MTIQEAVSEILRVKGKSIFKEQKLFFKYLDNLTPEYLKEARIIKNNFDEKILNLFIDDTKTPSNKVRLLYSTLEDFGLTQDNIYFLLESFGIPLGWGNEIRDLKAGLLIQNNINEKEQAQNQLILNPLIKDVSFNDNILKQWGVTNKKSLPVINIPATYKAINGDIYRITKIDDELFKDCTNLKSVNIPDSVIEIGNSVFEGCSALNKITIPNSVTKMGNRVFANCRSLTSIDLSDEITEMGITVFGGCISLTSVVIPNKITKLTECLFAKCKSLVNVFIPNGINEIGNLAFAGCESIVGIFIPESVTKIGNRAFVNCKSLKSIIIPNSLTYIGTEIFAGCNKLQQFTLPSKYTIFKDDVNKEITLKSNTPQLKPLQEEIDYIEVTLNEKVLKQLGYEVVYENEGYAFDSLVSFKKNGKNVTVFNIPDTYIYNGKNYKITQIGEKVFYRCRVLTTVTIPDSIINICDYAFYNCFLLTSVKIPNTVAQIGKEAFGGFFIYPVKHIEYHGKATGAPWGAKSMN